MRKGSGFRAVLALLAVTIASSCGARAPRFGRATRAAGDYEGELRTRDGRDRSFYVHVPQGWDGIRPLPMVLAFHGALATAASNEALMRWAPRADRHQFLLVEPDGVSVPLFGGVWNAGSCCGKASDEGVDDVAFVAQLIDELSASVPVDPARIYATGFSNGGAFAHRLGCELSGRIAAIAPVSGLLLDVDLDTKRRAFSCAPDRPVPILEIHGTRDRVALYDGGKSSCLTGSPTMPSVDATFSGWAQRNGCDSRSRVLVERAAATCISFEGCAAETTLCTVADLGHAWPGGQPISFPCLAPWSSALDATQTIWNFFERHSMSNAGPSLAPLPAL